MFIDIKTNNSGLSLLLTVLILSSILVTGLAASDLVLRVGRMSRQIGSSEIAYYAAETAAEEALYRIEQQGYGITGLSGSESLEDVDATWSRSIYANTQAPSTIASDDSIWTELTGDIENSNPLKVRLADGSSFEIDLNIQGAEYPSNITITWDGLNSQVVIYNQTDQDQSTEDTSPATINNLNNKSYRVRIINNSGFIVDYTLTPPADDALPIGVIISATGYFLDQERRLELESKKWQIY